VSGIVEATGPESITVDRTSYAVVEPRPEQFSTIVYLQGLGCISASPRDVRVGDAVLLMEQAVDGQGGSERALGRVVVRASGDGSTITGRITRSGVSGDDGVLLATPGRDFAVEHLASFAPSVSLSHDDAEPRAFELVSGRLAAGDAVTLRGRFRDGAFFVESMDVLARAARRTVRRRVHVEGVVTDADPRAFAVNGVAVDLTSAMRRSLRRNPANPGDRVSVGGRGSRRGHVVATTLRRA
jgi:hypothetical protein